MPRLRQAVIIIHGIGEQRPLDTLRGFADSMLPDKPVKDDEDARPKFWSKPDLGAESLEMRRFRSVHLLTNTDFYEYYWAHYMEGTRFVHILQWIPQLMFRNPLAIPRRVRLVWLAAWAVFLAVPLYPALLGVPSISPEAALAIALALWVLSFLLIRWVGDAARYLDASPQNIARRQLIRQEGIRLLKRLHDEGNYQRIIVVGHSLGSMIAYDILRHAWIAFNETSPEIAPVEQPALKNLEQAGEQVTAERNAATLSLFRQRQQELWFEQRRIGNRWLVTDFVTLGSPLSYASVLMAPAGGGLKMLKSRREAPTCPPDVSRTESPYSERRTYKTQHGNKRFKVLHHAGLFACTRWTNLYFPGDMIGGPLHGVLGHGIEDIRLDMTWRYRLTPFFSHSWYWRHDTTTTSLVSRVLEFLRLKRRSKHFVEEAAIKRLRAVLELDTPAWRKELRRISLETADYGGTKTPV